MELRQNPHNVFNWHKRVKLLEGQASRQIYAYTEAVKTVDPQQAVGKPHTLWCAFARLYERHKDLTNARQVMEKAVAAEFRYVDDLASVWCEWAEMELRHKNFRYTAGRALCCCGAVSTCLLAGMYVRHVCSAWLAGWRLCWQCSLRLVRCGSIPAALVGFQVWVWDLLGWMLRR